MVAKRKPSPAVKTLASKAAAPVKKKAAKQTVVVAGKATKKDRGRYSSNWQESTQAKS